MTTSRVSKEGARNIGCNTSDKHKITLLLAVSTFHNFVRKDLYLIEVIKRDMNQ